MMTRTLRRLLGLLMLSLILPSLLFAQQTGFFTGHVTTGADKLPVAGASVIPKGSKTGVATTVDGAFTIKAKPGDVLMITSVGMTPYEYTVGDQKEADISVQANRRELNEVVITATGIKKEAKKLGYATQTIDASALSTAREANPVNSLKGNAAGLTININSEIGHAPDVIIRGENDPGDRPMFVVDGVPISSDTYNINPDDIETYTVLKGPNAAALYGFQGKNGAIIISTKKGSKSAKKLAIDFNSSTQFNRGFTALPKYQDTYGAGDNGKYAFGGGGSSKDSYFGNGAVGTGVNDYDYDVWGPQFRGQLLPQYDGAYDANVNYTTKFLDPSQPDFVGHVMPTPYTARGKNNLTRFIQTGLLNSTSASISSSSEKTDIRFSLGNTYQKGIVPNTQLNNTSFTGSIVQRFNDKLSLTSYFNFSRQATPNLPDVEYGPNSIIYNMILWGGADWNVSDMRNYWQDGKTGIQQKYAEYYRYNNPYFMSYEWLRSHYQNTVYGYLSLNYKLNHNIDFQFRPSVSTYDMFNSEKMPYSAGAYGRELRQGDYREDRRSLTETNEDLQVRYHPNQLFGFLDLSALGGATARSLRFNSDFTSTNYLNVPGIYSFSNSLGAVTGSSFYSSMLVLSAYGSVDLGYKSYITANITGRVDKSSALPNSGNKYFYPSYNLASVVSEWIHLPQVISFFKIRGSYAQSKSGGTAPLFSPDVSATPAGGYGYYYASPYGGPSYQFSKQYTLGPTYNAQNSAVYTDQEVSSSIRTGERKALEFGADIRFFENKLGLDVTRYHYRNDNIISQGIPSASGYSTYLINGDTYTNDGWEATLTARPITNPRGFSWNVAVNFSTFVKKWVNYNSDPNNWVHNGTRTDLIYDNAFVRTSKGELVIDKDNGLYIRMGDLSPNPKKVYGHLDPDWQWGIVNNLSYKAFSFRFQFDGMVGGKIEDYVRKKTLQAGRHSESTSGEFGVARPYDEQGVAAYTGHGVNLDGPNGIVLDPITGKILNEKELTVSQNTTKSQVQPFVTRMANVPDLDIISKTFGKLREVVIGYTLPTGVLGRQKLFTKATISVVGRNLLYFFPNKYKDIDVDQYTQATYSPQSNGKFGGANTSSGLQTPSTRSYGFNLNLSF